MIHPFPIFQPGPVKANADTLSEAGAKALARTIERAWSNLGHAVAVRVVAVASSGREAPHFAVRSDLVGGLPRRRTEGAARQD